MKKTNKQAVQGVSWFLLNILLDCTTDAITKYLGQEGMHFSIIAFFRLAISTLLLLFYALIQPSSLAKTSNTKMYLYPLRGSIFFLASCLWTYGLRHNNMPTATLISFSIPLFVLLLAPIFLQEKSSFSLWSATFVGLFGIAMVLRPTTQVSFKDGCSAIGLLIAAILFAILDILNKYQVQEEPIFTMLFYSSLVAMFIGVPPLFYVWQTPSIWQGCWLFLLAIAGNLLLYAVLKAYEVVQVSRLAPLRYLGFLFSLAISYFLFQELPPQNVFYGALLIIPSVAYILKQAGK